MTISLSALVKFCSTGSVSTIVSTVTDIAKTHNTVIKGAAIPGVADLIWFRKIEAINCPLKIAWSQIPDHVWFSDIRYHHPLHIECHTKAGQVMMVGSKQTGQPAANPRLTTDMMMSGGEHEQIPQIQHNTTQTRQRIGMMCGKRLDWWAISVWHSLSHNHLHLHLTEILRKMGEVVNGEEDNFWGLNS